MTLPIILASSVQAAVLVGALVREVRLRRALQMLLSQLLGSLAPHGALGK